MEYYPFSATTVWSYNTWAAADITEELYKCITHSVCISLGGFLLKGKGDAHSLTDINRCVEKCPSVVGADVQSYNPTTEPKYGDHDNHVCYDKCTPGTAGATYPARHDTTSEATRLMTNIHDRTCVNMAECTGLQYF